MHSTIHPLPSSPPAGTDYSYWADNYTLFYLEAIAMNFAELKRLQDYK